MTDYGELRLPPERNAKNPLNGRFVKGMTPFNKGRKWSEWLSKPMQKKIRRIGIANFEKARHYPRPDVIERCSKPIIAVFDDGGFRQFRNSKQVGLWIGRGGHQNRNVRRCAASNQARGIGKNGKPNTDHRYLGIRWYYEDDNIWITKIKSNEEKTD